MTALSATRMAKADAAAAADAARVLAAFYLSRALTQAAAPVCAGAFEDPSRTM
jgi:hypothetical protein